MADSSVVGEVEHGPDLFLGKSRAFWTARSTAVLLGGVLGVPGGVLAAALLLWAAGPDHWIMGSWFLVGAGITAIHACSMMLISLFLWWINHGIKRSY